LKGLFSRLQYTRSSYTSPPTHAITRLTFPLKNGARDPYYVDTIGNVSTSRFRPARGTSDANLEISPRYPVYGGWNYTFRIGWNVDLEKVSRVSGTERVLKIPFVEGTENIQYETFVVNVILPEGARCAPLLCDAEYRDVRVFTPQPPLSEERYLHRTFLDTVGRTAVKLTFKNVVDEKRGREIIVVYVYPRFAGLRKVVVVVLGVLGLFVTRLVGGWIFEGGIGGK
jgi:oligosaccharyltransferase complex subunit alpha (ribophorin I)